MALALASASYAHAADDEGGISAILFSRHMLSAGVTGQRTDATIRATVAGFEPVSIGLDDVGIDERDTSYYLDYRYRFSQNWSLFAGGYSYAGAGSASISQDFNYDGVEFTAGANLRADFDVDAYLFSVMYKLFRSEEFELLLGGGLHALDLSASLAANVRLNEFESEFRQSGTTLLAPVPNLRIAASWAPTNRLGFTAVGGWLSANVDNYDGAFTYGHLRALLRLGKSSAIGLGYQVTDVDITESQGSGELNYNVRLTGPTLSFSYAF
jgi:hypothetical protein